MKTTALIVAAGSSVRFGGPIPKQFMPINWRPLLAWTVERFDKAQSISDIIVVVAEDQLIYVADKILFPYKLTKPLKIVPGGVTRQESVLRGLEQVPVSTKLVAIHDGARPLTSPHDIDAVVDLAGREKAAILAVRVPDTVKRVKDDYILSTQDRNDLWLAQTPQVFDYDLIIEAHRRVARDGVVVTDDAALVEASGFKVRVVEPKLANFKVTTREDLRAAEAMLKGELGE
jgi:2-C-methyl-D-erythritol 4-phosphate cytidylyltransferase